MTLTKRPLPRFALVFAVGFAAVTALAWVAAATEAHHLLWLAKEHWATALGFVVAAAAAWCARLAVPVEVLAATAVATLLHIVIYHVPLAILIELPLTRYAVVEFGTIAGWLAVGYGLTLAAVVTIHSLRKTGDFA